VIGGVLVAVLEADGIAGADDERRAELIDPGSRSSDSEPGSVRASRSAEATRVEEQPERVHARQRGHSGRGRVVVDEHEERDPISLDEVGCVVSVAGPDRDDLTPRPADLLVAVAQLRGVLAAEQSAEMPEEHDDRGLVAPHVRHPMGRTLGIGELHSPERL